MNLEKGGRYSSLRARQSEEQRFTSAQALCFMRDILLATLQATAVIAMHLYKELKDECNNGVGQEPEQKPKNYV